MSSSDTFSIIVWFWHDLLTNTTQMKVVRVDTNEEVHLSDGSFLLRISHDKDIAVERCLIRHMPSGREAYVQGGSNLRAFIKDCVLKSDETTQDATDQPQV
jgi:hypothetical protein